MAGAEQVQWALDTGADVVLMGRVADAALYAAIPLAAGHDPALVWNAAKIMECGAAAALNRRGQDSLLCTLDADGFVLEAPDPDLVCTPASVAAHTLYEVSDPYRLVMPSGVLDSREARYEALDDRRVRVTGGRWTPSEQYTVKLEGSAPLGFLSSFWGSISDPLLLGQLDAWCASVEDRLRVRLGEVGAGSFEVAVRTYGAGATTAQHGAVPREAVLVVDVVGQTQDAASAMARAAYHVALHWPIQGWSGGSVTSFAHPYSAPVVDRGPVYRFTLNHAAVLGDDEITGLFRLETHRVGAA
nr:acyclic terpene utilization AtuA family protein [Rhabdothermincola salaria]